MTEYIEGLPSNEKLFFTHLIHKVQDDFGVGHSPEGQVRLVEAVKARQAWLGLPSLVAYEGLLAHSQEEWGRLWANYLDTDGVLLRPNAQLEVAADLLSEWSILAPERTLRVLSLGCGPGFETTSLAIMLEKTTLTAKNWQVDIHGLDLNPMAIIRAEEALFTPVDLQWLPEHLAKRWFAPRLGKFRFKTELATTIHLAVGNALDPTSWPWPGPFDMIFCRGLFFDSPSPTQLTSVLTQVLAPTGFIFTAPGEFLPLTTHDLHLEERNGVTYYRRGAQPGKANQHHKTKRQASGRRPSPLPNTSPSLAPLLPREVHLLEAAENELQLKHYEKAWELVSEVLLSAMDQYRPAPEAWKFIARFEEALNRPETAQAAWQASQAY